MTLLAALAARSIAVPLSPVFPPKELQYILNQSEACLLLSSNKFTPQAQRVLQTELTSSPTHLELAKHHRGRQEEIEWDESGPGAAGMMLYTSGTTNKPVRSRPPCAAQSLSFVRI